MPPDVSLTSGGRFDESEALEGVGRVALRTLPPEPGVQGIPDAVRQEVHGDREQEHR